MLIKMNFRYYKCLSDKYFDIFRIPKNEFKMPRRLSVLQVTDPKLSKYVEKLKVIARSVKNLGQNTKHYLGTRYLDKDKERYKLNNEYISNKISTKIYNKIDIDNKKTKDEDKKEVHVVNKENEEEKVQNI